MPTSETAQAGPVWFGYEQTTAGEKRRRVRDLFASVTERYDLMNDLMSLGTHRIWKFMLVTALDPAPGRKLIDVAAGTGDIARGWLMRASRHPYRSRTNIPVPAHASLIDPSEAMLQTGQARWLDKGISAGPGRLFCADWICGDAQALPIGNAQYDSYAISFGLRNLVDIGEALAEARRVLRPGGKFAALEFGAEINPALGPLYDLWSFSVIPRMGRMIAGNEAAYHYLAESIRRFPPRTHIVDMLLAAGFERVRAHPLSGGIVTLFTGRLL